MAVTIVRTDDVNGDSGATATVVTINGEGVEVDLGERSLHALREALAPFFTAGRAGSYDVAPTNGRASRRKRDTADHDYDTAAVRAWAAQQGIHLNGRGRIPRDVIDRYQAAS